MDCIVGAGLCGSLLATLLANRYNVSVNVYERRGDPRKETIEGGRSINLALSTRGKTALLRAGVPEKDFEALCIPMRGRTIHELNGSTVYQSYSATNTDAIYSISRGGLNLLLINQAERAGAKFHFNSILSGIDRRSKALNFKNKDSTRYNTLFAADGAFSACRGSFINAPEFNYSQLFSTHGYKELTIPPGKDGKHQIAVNTLHIWPRGTYMMIALPNMDGSFTVTLFMPLRSSRNGDVAFDTLNSEKAVLSFFTTQYPDIVPLMPDLLQDYKDNPVGTMVTVRCFPYNIAPRTLLMGDAAHAIVPFFGQGMNCAFEDVTVVDDVLKKYGMANIDEALLEYQHLRKTNCDAIADMAHENYIEMRDKVADDTFRFHKQVMDLLGRKFPNQFRSRYEWVSFSNIKYRDAYAKGITNDKIIHQLCDGKTSVDQIDLKQAKMLLDRAYPVSKL